MSERAARDRIERVVRTHPLIPFEQQQMMLRIVEEAFGDPGTDDLTRQFDAWLR